MSRLFLFLFAFIFTLLSFNVSAYADMEPPFLPASYYGSVKFANGDAVPAGTVQAYVEGEKRGELSFTGGFYGSEYGGLKLTVQGPNEIYGNPVTFVVVINGRSYQAQPNEPVILEAEDIRQVDLTITCCTKVTAPNGNEDWLTGSSHNVTWEYNGGCCASDAMISLYKNDVFQYVIAPNVSMSGGSCSWTIPASQAAGSDYKIRVCCNEDDNICDFSDGSFSISSPIAVTSPNGGESWVVGTTRDITWNCVGADCSSDVRVSLYKGGIKQYLIASNVPVGDGLYRWTIPASQSTGNDYQIRVSCNADYNICDYSDSNFSISGPIAVTSPNGGENWAAGTTRDITWSHLGAGSAHVKISLYRGSKRQRVIASSVPIGDGLYRWTIPASQSAGSDYRILISSCYAGRSICEFSDSFTISSP